MLLTKEANVAIYGASLPLILAVSLMIGVLPRAALGAVIYSNGFESGVPVTEVVLGEPLEPGPNGFCSRAGTTRLLSHIGCPTVVPPSSIGAGSGRFVAFADPDQETGGATLLGSVFGFPPIPLVDGWHGLYEFSFDGVGVRELIFLDQVWTPFSFSPDPDPPFGGAIPQDFDSSSLDGESLSIHDDRYVFTFDLDERTRFFDSLFPPGSTIDEARFRFCGSLEEGTDCTLNWTFAIDNGGWIDNINLDFLGSDQDGTDVPEPGTASLVLTGLLAAAIMKFRRRGSVLHGYRRNKSIA
jgi:hypothetical protein